MAIVITREKQAANAITISRVVVALYGAPWLARNLSTGPVVLLAIIAVTDKVDGWVARHYHCETEFGKFIDPTGDKIVFYWYMGWLMQVLVVRGSSLAAVATFFVLLPLARLDAMSTKRYYDEWRGGTITGANSRGQLKTLMCLTALLGSFVTLVRNPHPVGSVVGIIVVCMAVAWWEASASTRLKRASA